MAPSSDSRPSKPASSTALKYLERDIKELKDKKADAKYVEAMDMSLQELIGSKLGDVDQMKKFIVTALIAAALVVTGVGGTYIVRFTNLTNSVEAHTRVIESNGRDIKTVSESLSKHATTQEIQRVQDSAALDSKLSTMEQRLTNALARVSEGKRLEAPSEEEYIERRKKQLQRQLERLEASEAVTLSPELRRSITKSVDAELAEIKAH